MGTISRNRIGFAIALGLGLLITTFCIAAKKPQVSGTQAVQNKTCGYYLRYPKGSQLDHPSDCVLKITPPSNLYPKWVSELSLTLYTATLDQPALGQTPDGDPNAKPVGSIKGGGMTFQKTLYEDAAMSHRMITWVYEGRGKYRKYRFEGYLRGTVPEVMDLHVKDWDPDKFAEKTFDEMVETFVPMK